VYTLYIGNKNYSSWSLRPWILLTELEIPFKEILVPFDDDGSWEKFRAFSPTGLVPCLHDDDIIVWESMAITEYVAEQHRQVWPESHNARAWARSAAAEMHAGFTELRTQCPMTVGMRIRLREISAGLGRDLNRLDELWSEGMQRFGGPYLAGAHFTAVDAFFAPMAFRVQTFDLPLSEACQTYAATLLALPGMAAWTEAALVEPYREESHERELENLGKVVEDLRT